MSELQQLIEKYQTATNDDARAEMIRDEFEFLTDSSKWEFLLPLIEQELTYDLVKVNVYKMIEITDFSELDIIAVKDRIVHALKAETDELVKQHGFMALLWNFSTFPDVIDLCMSTIEDEEEDENVRHCAFDVLIKSKDVEKMNTLRHRLLENKHFGKYAATFFEERDKN